MLKIPSANREHLTAATFWNILEPSRTVVLSLVLCREFLPSPGFLRHLQAPPTSDNVRIDTGVRQGKTIVTLSPSLPLLLPLSLCLGSRFDAQLVFSS